MKTLKPVKHISDRLTIEKEIYDYSDDSQGYREYFTQGDLKGIVLSMIIGIIFFLFTNSVLLFFINNKLYVISLALCIGITSTLLLLIKVGNKKIVFYFYYLCLKRLYVLKNGKRIGASRLKKHVRMEKALRAAQKDFDEIIF